VPHVLQRDEVGQFDQLRIAEALTQSCEQLVGHLPR
jgi:hypothetical protein